MQLHILILYVTLLTFCACGSTSSTNDTADTASLTSTFSSIKSNILSTITCARSLCHNAASAQNGLDLETNPYTALVGVASQTASMNRVTAGDTSQSYLVHKLENTQSAVTGGAGVQMPKDGTPLTTDQINTIKEWINNGALNN